MGELHLTFSRKDRTCQLVSLRLVQAGRSVCPGTSGGSSCFSPEPDQDCVPLAAADNLVTELRLQCSSWSEQG